MKYLTIVCMLITSAPCFAQVGNDACSFAPFGEPPGSGRVEGLQGSDALTFGGVANFVPVQQIRSCFASVGFNSTIANASIINTFAAMRHYSLQDAVQEGVHPLPGGINIFGRLKELRSRQFPSDWDFHEALQQGVSRQLYDKHTVYIKPKCYSIAAVLPIWPSAKFVNGRLSFTLQQLRFGGVSVTSSVAQQLVPYVGWEIEAIDGIEAENAMREFVSGKQHKQETNSVDAAARFTSAVRDITYSVRDLRESDLPSANQVQLTLKNPISGGSRNVVVPWWGLPLFVSRDRADFMSVCMQETIASQVRAESSECLSSDAEPVQEPMDALNRRRAQSAAQDRNSRVSLRHMQLESLSRFLGEDTPRLSSTSAIHSVPRPQVRINGFDRLKPAPAPGRSVGYRRIGTAIPPFHATPELPVVGYPRQIQAAAGRQTAELGHPSTPLRWHSSVLSDTMAEDGITVTLLRAMDPQVATSDAAISYWNQLVEPSISASGPDSSGSAGSDPATGTIPPLPEGPPPAGIRAFVILRIGTFKPAYIDACFRGVTTNPCATPAEQGAARACYAEGLNRFFLRSTDVAHRAFRKHWASAMVVDLMGNRGGNVLLGQLTAVQLVPQLATDPAQASPAYALRPSAALAASAAWLEAAYPQLVSPSLLDDFTLSLFWSEGRQAWSGATRESRARGPSFQWFYDSGETQSYRDRTKQYPISLPVRIVNPESLLTLRTDKTIGDVVRDATPLNGTNLLLVTDGLCGSMCGQFHDTLRAQAGARTLVLGGMPGAGSRPTTFEGGFVENGLDRLMTAVETAKATGMQSSELLHTTNDIGLAVRIARGNAAVAPGSQGVASSSAQASMDPKEWPVALLDQPGSPGDADPDYLKLRLAKSWRPGRWLSSARVSVNCGHMLAWERKEWPLQLQPMNADRVHHVYASSVLDTAVLEAVARTLDEAWSMFAPAVDDRGNESTDDSIPQLLQDAGVIGMSMAAGATLGYWLHMMFAGDCICQRTGDPENAKRRSSAYAEDRGCCGRGSRERPRRVSPATGATPATHDLDTTNEDPPPTMWMPPSSSASSSSLRSMLPPQSQIAGARARSVMDKGNVAGAVAVAPIGRLDMSQHWSAPHMQALHRGEASGHLRMPAQQQAETRLQPKQQLSSYSTTDLLMMDETGAGYAWDGGSKSSALHGHGGMVRNLHSKSVRWDHDSRRRRSKDVAPLLKSRSMSNRGMFLSNEIWNGRRQGGMTDRTLAEHETAATAVATKNTTHTSGNHRAQLGSRSSNKRDEIDHDTGHEHKLRSKHGHRKPRQSSRSDRVPARGHCDRKSSKDGSEVSGPLTLGTGNSKTGGKNDGSGDDRGKRKPWWTADDATRRGRHVEPSLVRGGTYNRRRDRDRHRVIPIGSDSVSSLSGKHTQEGIGDDACIEEDEVPLRPSASLTGSASASASASFSQAGDEGINSKMNNVSGVEVHISAFYDRCTTELGADMGVSVDEMKRRDDLKAIVGVDRVTVDGQEVEREKQDGVNRLHWSEGQEEHHQQHITTSSGSEAMEYLGSKPPADFQGGMVDRFHSGLSQSRGMSGPGSSCSPQNQDKQGESDVAEDWEDSNGSLVA